MELKQLYESLREWLVETQFGVRIAHGLMRRNLPVTYAMQFYSSGDLKGDTTSEYIEEILSKASSMIGNRILEVGEISDDTPSELATLQFELDWLHSNSNEVIDYSEFLNRLIETLLNPYMPGIDDYVQSMKNSDLHQELGLSHDDNFLVDISHESNFSLRKHGLIVSDEVMVYPHQFLRRHYSSNFTDTPEVLAAYAHRGMSVKVRLDPLRSWTHPKNYMDILELDYWHGPQFSAEVLNDTDAKEKVTFHSSPSIGYSPYPVTATIFRTYMMEANCRQFMIEEYTPLKPADDSPQLPGFGNEYCIQKFGHFVFDQEEQAIVHVDGAVRVFKVEEYRDIYDAIRQGKSPDSKIGVRHKLFLVEGKLDLNDAQILMAEFFRYNTHLSEYFQGG